MASDVEELIEMLFDMVDQAKNVPLKPDLCMLIRNDLLDLIEDIKLQFPSELREARKLIAARKEYISAAKREAEMTLERAKSEAKRMMEEDTVLIQSRQTAAELIRNAEESSRELKRSANEYCEDALRRTEEAVTEACDEIKKSRARFCAAASGADISQIKSK